MTEREPDETYAPQEFPEIPELEFDENEAPRPEEEIADAARSTPDLTDRAGTDGRTDDSV
jgi:hypothetical protein